MHEAPAAVRVAPLLVPTTPPSEEAEQQRFDKRLRRPRKSFVAIPLPERYKCGAMQQKTTVRKQGQPYSNGYY